MRNVNVKLPDGLYQHIQDQAAKHFQTMSEYIRQLVVDDYVRETVKD